MFNTQSAAGAVSGFVAIIYIIGGIFVGPLGQLLGDNLAVKISRFLPTYYLAEGVMNASQSLGTWSSHLLDMGVLLGSTLVLLQFLSGRSVANQQCWR